jgi:hypothetical protein
VNQHSNDHIAAELVVLGGVLQRVPVDVRHQRIEEYHVDQKQDLHGCCCWVEVHSYLPVAEYVVKEGVIDDQSLQTVVDLESSNVKWIVFLNSYLLFLCVLPYVQLRGLWLVHEDS